MTFTEEKNKDGGYCHLCVIRTAEKYLEPATPTHALNELTNDKGLTWRTIKCKAKKFRCFNDMGGHTCPLDICEACIDNWTKKTDF